MKIKFGKYILNSDRFCFWIDEEYEIEKGKTKGETAIRPLTGYCWTLERCLKTFRERTIGKSEATTLAELLSVLESVFEDMDAINRINFEEEMKKLKEMSECTH